MIRFRAFLLRVLERLPRGLRSFLRRWRPIETRWAEALMEHGADRQAHLREVTDKLRIKMEAQSLRVRDLVLTQPLFSYLAIYKHSYTWASPRHQTNRTSLLGRSIKT